MDGTVWPIRGVNEGRRGIQAVLFLFGMFANWKVE